jgi:hypothetical protein
MSCDELSEEQDMQEYSLGNRKILLHLSNKWTLLEVKRMLV